MGNNIGNNLIIERQLANEPINIKLGVCGSIGDPQNPYRTQCIKINNEFNAHSLLAFCETSNALIYDFEDDIKLTIMKSNNKINYNIKNPNINLTCEMDSVHRKWIKTISMSSNELDKIVDFVKLPEE